MKQISDPNAQFDCIDMELEYANQKIDVLKDVICELRKDNRNLHITLAATILECGGKISIPENILASIHPDIKISSYDEPRTRTRVYSVESNIT
jgi:hypothetical protein